MKTGAKVLIGFFTTLGVIFFLLLLVLMYLWWSDPFGIKPMLSLLGETVTEEEAVNSQAVTTQSENVTDTAVGVNLTHEQAAILEQVGVNQAEVPDSFTAEQIVCFESILGAPRVAEIKAGATPTLSEVFRARVCLE